MPRAETWARGMLVAALASSAALTLALSAPGCRAQITMTSDDAADASADADLAYVGPDIATVPDLACSTTGPEVCGNGCDDDRNGFADDDDPVCTTQLLVGYDVASGTLDRLVLEPAPHVVAIDNHTEPANIFATLRASVGPDVYVAFPQAGMNTVRRIDRVDGGMSDQIVAYNSRAVCTFGSELIVVERNLPSQLHRLMRDGKTEIGTVPLGATNLATSCASDGNKLYVAVHDTSLNPSQILVFDSTYTQGAPIPLPPSLAAGGYTRLLAFAWTRRAGLFYGLFSSSPILSDTQTATQLIPFALDGAAGAPVDAGTYASVGEFVP
jgi:hypothetical protein